MYRNDEEIEIIEVPEWIWWNPQTDMQVPENIAGAEKRHILRPKQVHFFCHGELELLDREHELYQRWLRCTRCGKEFIGNL